MYVHKWTHLWHACFLTREGVIMRSKTVSNGLGSMHYTHKHQIHMYIYVFWTHPTRAVRERGGSDLRKHITMTHMRIPTRLTEWGKDVFGKKIKRRNKYAHEPESRGDYAIPRFVNGALGGLAQVLPMPYMFFRGRWSFYGNDSRLSSAEIFWLHIIITRL